jgi:hypothetical protein
LARQASAFKHVSKLIESFGYDEDLESLDPSKWLNLLGTKKQANQPNTLQRFNLKFVLSFCVLGIVILLILVKALLQLDVISLIKRFSFE